MGTWTHVRLALDRRQPCMASEQQEGALLPPEKEESLEVNQGKKIPRGMMNREEHQGLKEQSLGLVWTH